MEFYQISDSNYQRALKSHLRKYVIRVEFLSYYESEIKNATQRAIKDVVGSLNINRQQLTRRTCSLSLLNCVGKTCEMVNYGDKFRLYIGIEDGDDVYWFSQGVFAIQNAVRSDDYFTLEGVDKGGILDGSLGMNIVDSQYIIPSGENIRDVIIDTLGLNIESYNHQSIRSSALSRPIDPQSPIVDFKFRNYVTQSEISIDTNAPVGDLLTFLADGYSAEVYYDINGRLIFADDLAMQTGNGYGKLPIKWTFKEDQVSNVQYTRNSDVKNVVTVYTNSSEFENVSEVIRNNNPSSPNRIDFVGVRRMNSVEIPYVGESPDEQRKYCVAHGEYLLSQEEFNQNSISFSAILVPHLDVGDRIMYKEDSFVINSIDINLDGTEMSIVATQIQ